MTEATPGSPDVDAASGKPENPPKSGCGLGCLLWLGVGVVAVAAFGIIGAISAEDDSIGGVNSPDGAAIVACENMIEQQLRAPATADFESQVRTVGEARTVTGHVDSQNGFGATVRSNFECRVTFPGGGQTSTTIVSLG